MSKTYFPGRAMFEVTKRCAQRCVHCYIDDFSGKGELNTEEAKKVIRELDELNCLELTFTGGEVFMRKDFMELLRYARELHFNIIIYTEANLIDEEIADQLKAIAPWKLEVTLLGPDAELHDRLVQKKGAFERTLRGIKLLLERNIRVTGKTILIQMLAGMINDYCEIAGYPFHYENFGVDQISSYQGKSGQNCKAFVDNVHNPLAIGFGTIDDIDQVAAQRSDDQAAAGQQEVTAVLMEAFAGASTVVRGNCSFGMFSNYPENVDDALRQRAGARWLVDGPQSLDDYIDIFALLAGKNHSIPLGAHDLFANQEIKQAVARS